MISRIPNLLPLRLSMSAAVALLGLTIPADYCTAQHTPTHYPTSHDLAMQRHREREQTSSMMLRHQEQMQHREMMRTPYYPQQQINPLTYLYDPAYYARLSPMQKWQVRIWRRQYERAQRMAARRNRW